MAPHPARYVDIIDPDARRGRSRSRRAALRQRRSRLRRRVLRAHRLGGRSAPRRGASLYTERLVPLDRRGERPSKLTWPGAGARQATTAPGISVRPTRARGIFVRGGVPAIVSPLRL